jgi:hypothetical protein
VLIGGVVSAGTLGAYSMACSNASSGISPGFLFDS